MSALLPTAAAPARQPAAGVGAPEAAVPTLDAPLPAELAGSNQGWLTRYHRYPVFSRPWARGRWRAWGVGLVAWCLCVMLNLEPQPGPPGTLAMAWVSVVLATLFWFGLPMWLGPALAGWVRRRAWPVRAETLALVLAIAAAVGLTKVADPLLRVPAKQWLNDRIVGPGQPLVVVMIGGVRVEQALLTPSGAPYAPALHADAKARPPGAAASASWAAQQAVGNPFVEGVLASVWVVLMALAGGALGVLGVQRERSGLAAWRARCQAAEADRARHEAELRLAVLQAQVEPHFLFNTLAGVRGAIGADPGRAAQMIDRLVDYLRAAVPRLRGGAAAEAASTLGAQFDSARAYLALMQLRMPRLAFDVSLPAPLREGACPPLVLITLVENAVKHGVEPKLGPARITLTAERIDAASPAGGSGVAPPRVAIEVCDDGVGFSATGGQGLGLVNLRERLAALYGERAGFELRARPEGGVCARLVLPLEQAAAASVPPQQP